MRAKQQAVKHVADRVRRGSAPTGHIDRRGFASINACRSLASCCLDNNGQAQVKPPGPLTAAVMDAHILKKRANYVYTE